MHDIDQLNPSHFESTYQGNAHAVAPVPASDEVHNTNQAIAVTVGNVNDNAPVITSLATAGVAENTTAVTTVAAGDADGDTLTYSIVGGADAAPSPSMPRPVPSPSRPHRLREPD